MAFLDNLIFPTDISIEAEVVRRWAAEVTINDGGWEDRSNPWQYPLHEFDVPWGVKENADLERLQRIFHVCEGMTHGFRFLDPLDNKSSALADAIAYDDQVQLASAVGGETSVQLLKVYSESGYSMSRKITRPYGTVLLGINGAPKTEGTEFSVDLTTGLVDLTGGSAPHGALGAGDSVTAGFAFHVPARFNINSLAFRLHTGELGSSTVPLVEVRE